jgi:opacity protein-like surface antigen
MKKVILILLASSAVATNAVADFYISGKMGPSFNVGKTAYQTQLPGGTGNSAVYKGGAGNGLLFGAALGYDQIMGNDFYLGAEASIFKHTLSNTISSANKITLRNNTLYGADLHFGYKIAGDIIPFMSLGVWGGKFKSSITTTAAFSSKTKTIIAVVPGIGLKYGVCDSWMVTSQYQYLMGKKISQNLTSSASQSSLSQNIRQHQVLIGLSYKL